MVTDILTDRASEMALDCASDCLSLRAATRIAIIGRTEKPKNRMFVHLDRLKTLHPKFERRGRRSKGVNGGSIRRSGFAVKGCLQKVNSK